MSDKKAVVEVKEVEKKEVEEKEVIHSAVGTGTNKKVYRASDTVIQLSREYKFDGVWKSELVMREPTIKDENIARESITKEDELQERLFCNLCDIGIDDLSQFALKDAYRVMGAYNNFLL